MEESLGKYIVMADNSIEIQATLGYYFKRGLKATEAVYRMQERSEYLTVLPKTCLSVLREVNGFLK